MLKCLLLLISCIVIAPLTCAEEQANPVEHKLNYDGFVTATTFNRSEYFPTRYMASITAQYYVSDDFTLKGSINKTNNSLNVNRAVIEYAASHLIFDTDVIVQVGRYPRINSLYNDVTDNPGTHGMSLLPQGVYPYRIVKTFVTLSDGINVTLIKQVANGLINVRAAVGSGVIVNKRDLSLAFLGTDDPSANITTSKKHAYDLALSYERFAWKIVLSRGEFPYYSDLPFIKDLDTTITTLGISYTWRALTVDCEVARHAFRYSDPEYGETLNQDYIGKSFTVKYSLTETLSVYGKLDTGAYRGAQPPEGFNTGTIGITHDSHKWSTSVELTRGKSNTKSSIYNDNTNPNVIAVSVTRRF